MSWTQQLCLTYDENVERSMEQKHVMAPISHMIANAQIEIELGENGEFRFATTLQKDEGETIIPVTESSASRSSGIAPHPLCDKLPYIAGDYGEFVHTVKEREKANGKHNSYMKNLKEWIDSDFTHSKIIVIYKYLSEQRLIHDLVNCGIIGLDDSDLFDNAKINGTSYENALVRFCVYGNDNITEKVWEDKLLIQSYINYYSSLNNQKEICYITGRESIVSENHPKGIVASNHNAKIVSANDEQGFTFRGRFQNANQAYSLSYEVSQKVHNALAWMVKRQGVSVGRTAKRTFVCWNPQDKETPDITNPFYFENDYDEVGILYQRRLKKLFFDKYQNFNDEDNIIVMCLDAATTGRLSITFYNEYMAKTFFENVIYWGETCCWRFVYWENDCPKNKIMTPSFVSIVECAFGTQKDKFLDVDDRVLKERVERLVKCMLDKNHIPVDFVQAIFERASTPLAYSTTNRERVLSTACAVIIKYYYDQKRITKGEDEPMQLDRNKTDRSYLFGRLLAVYEKVERQTYDRGENRETNAIRLQSAFVHHPMQTWKVLEDVIEPYLRDLTADSREYYKQLISEIVALFPDEGNDKMNQNLKESYLLGYYLQREDLNKSRKEKEK